jgi:hypothetical protein
MNDVIHHWLNSLTRYTLLRGYGWQMRTVSATKTREWRDPSSGLWYGERKAIAILKDQALALYDREDQPRRPYSLRC